MGGRGNGDSVFNGSRVPVWEAENVLEMDGGARIKNYRTKPNGLLSDP